MFELTWADKTRKGTGIAAAYIKALYESKTDPTPDTEGQFWEEMVKKLHEQGLNIAKRRVGDMRIGERPMLPSHALTFITYSIDESTGEKPWRIARFTTCKKAKRNAEEIASPRSRNSDNEGLGEIWLVSTQEDRAYLEKYVEDKKRVNTIAHS